VVDGSDRSSDGSALVVPTAPHAGTSSDDRLSLERARPSVAAAVQHHRGKEVDMNDDTFAGRWKQVRGKAKEWWGQLTDDELDRIEGKKDQLVGALQAKYGYTKDQAEAEIDRRMSQAA
jgi:uncharacterized protein YjbJ (UPF0337 family)